MGLRSVWHQSVGLNENRNQDLVLDPKISVHTLVYAHLSAYRVVVLVSFLCAAGRLPGLFACPAGCGDVMVGLTALMVGARAARSDNDQLVILWNWLGISDLVIAMATGFLSAPSRFQIFSLDAPNVLIGSFPLVMVPIFAVPLSIVLHLASLSKISAAHRSLLKQAVSV